MFFLEEDTSGSLASSMNGFSMALQIAIFVVVALIIIVALISGGVSIFLSIRYMKYNRRENSCGMTGEEIARKVLDNNGLQNIKVSKNGSIMFGNSYSHYFKKVRLRRLTWKKKSVTSLAMATQKSCLAVLDKEGDPDMKQRIRLIPIIDFGPLMFVPLCIIGFLIDIVVFNSSGICTIIFTVLGLLFYLFSIILNVKELKTEKKAQERAYTLAKDENLATDEEIEMMKDLFHLYNIEYINNIILAVLELILRILQIVLELSNGNGSTSTSNN